MQSVLFATSTNGGNADPYTTDSSTYSFTSAATTPPGPKAVTSADSVATV